MTSLILRMDNLLAGKLTSRWEAKLPHDFQHCLLYMPVENIPLKPITIPLAGDCRSPSAWNR
jgi:hypothetical protein